MERNKAWDLLRKYNKEPFHLRHALTVEGVMRYFAEQRGEDADFWGVAGLLHDIDFEMWPEEHCRKAPELLREGGADEAVVHAVCSHGWGECSDVEPTHEMEKLLFAADELTGLIWSASLMRPSKSVQDMELKSLKKKFKDKKFAAGCSREIILKGAELCGLTLEELMQQTLDAMRETEDAVNARMEQLEAEPEKHNKSRPAGRLLSYLQDYLLRRRW